MNRHETDYLSLIFGIALAGAGALLLFDRVDLLVRLRWAWPLLLITLAVLMLASTAPWRRPSAEPPVAAAQTPSGRASDAGPPPGRLAE